MIRTHKIALDINNKQKTYLSKCAGISRFAYNWALSEWNTMYEAYKSDSYLPKPNQFIIRRRLNSIKRDLFPWMMEVTKCAPQEAIIDLDKAWNNYFSGRTGRPIFKKKGIHDSFRVSNDFFKVSGSTLRLPIIGMLRMRESLRYNGARLVSVTISRRADRWYASIVCEIPDYAQVKSKGALSEKVIGVDAGVHAYITSDGEVYETPRSYRNAEKRLRRVQKSLSRKQKGSRNREKQKRKVARIHARVSDIRSDFLHKMTTEIVNSANTIVIEDLNVKGMVRNKYLAKSIADASFGEFRRQLAYKAEAAGKTLIVADRFYPSTKLCSACGAKTKRLSLGMREWVCENCGTKHDRDINAAVNLKKYAGSSPVSACGEFIASARTAYSRPGASSLDEAGTKRQIA